MSFLSLAQKVKQLVGLSNDRARKSIIPETRAAAYKTLAGGPEANLRDAIERRQPVAFFYVDKWQPPGTPGASGLRVGNPHAVYIGPPGGDKYLHMYVDARAATATGQLPGWRTFIVSRINDVSIYDLGKSFFGKDVKFPIAPGYNQGWYGRNGRPIVLAGQ
jgi:hypothetical protein